MLHAMLRKPMAYSGTVKLGSISVQATWDIIDDECLMLRVLGLLSGEQQDALAEYRYRSTTLRVQLPGCSELLAEIVGYDKAERSFCLSIHG